ncbi:alcohol dehydrogenase catalytic domain-containing protein [Rubrobacter tropicus]|nr:Zn-dependent alcohol dehydrogenase [Rubrobacter tropicus]
MGPAQTVRARVFEAPGEALAARELRLAEIRDDLVRVRLRASGVCGSDLHVADGDWTARGPLVLGHEGAGTVEEVGPGVKDVRVGDGVVLSWFAPCRRCRNCAGGRAWLCQNTKALENTLPDGTTSFEAPDGEPVPAFLGLGTFAEATVVPESAAVKIPDGVPFPVAALIGCSVTTGVGAVVNTARVRTGDSAVVIGCGGVGQAVLLGLGLAGADPIVAVDLSEERLALARELGATHALGGDDPDLEDHIRSITGEGADHAFEAIGRAATMGMLTSLVCRGGQAVIVGMPAEGVTVPLDPFDLADGGKRVLGCNYGSSVPSVDFPKLARLYASGRLPLDRLVGRTATLDEVDGALDDLRRTVGLRTIIRHGNGS